MTAPDKIYLTSLFVKACGEILSERAKEDDVEYIRKDLIKAEIERRKRELDEQIVDIQDSKAVLRKDELQRLLSRLSILESERPINQSTRQRLAEWSKTPEGGESYEKVASEMRREIAHKAQGQGKQ